MKTVLSLRGWLLGGLIALLVMVPAIGWAEDTTVVGEVNEQGELIASEDDTIYRVVGGEMGQTLLEAHTGDKVQARGVVVGEERAAEDDPRMVKLFEVTSFSVLAE